MAGGAFATLFYKLALVANLVITGKTSPNNKLKEAGVESGKTRPLGVMDSGVGGLSVMREIRRLLPQEDLLYFADRGNCPYGTRPPAELLALTRQACGYLLDEGAKALVIACNTASTASVAQLRLEWPEIPIVGMVPAVKPAASQTKTGVIGVLATQATGRAPVLQDVIDRFATGLEVLIAAPIGLVEAVEAGQTSSPATIAILETALAPLLVGGADALVLGCTHFPFLRPALESILQGRMHLIDSGDAVAQQTGRVLAAAGLLNPQSGQGRLVCYTTGEPLASRQVIAQLLDLADPTSLDLRFVPPARTA